MPSWIINQVYTMSRYGVKFHISETLTVSLTSSHHMSIRLTNKLTRAGTQLFSKGKEVLYWQWMNSLEKSQLHRDGSISEEKPFAMTDVWGLFTVQIFRGFKKERQIPGCLKELYPHSWEAESRERWSLGWSSSWHIFSVKEWAALGPGVFRGLWVGGQWDSLGIQYLPPVDNHIVLHLNLGSV